MERKLDPAPGQNFAVGRRLDRDIAKTFAQDRRRLAMADINIRAEARMVGMRMGDDCALNGAPGIDVKVPGGAVKSAVG